MSSDLYQILGISRTASDVEIKKAYRNLARKFHPDANPGDAEAERRFKEIAQAYEILSDQNLRQQYDRFGTIGGQGQSGFQATGGISDLFDAFFGGSNPFGGSGARNSGPAVGQDVEVLVTVSLDEVVKGGETSFEVDIAAPCEKCEGSGSADGDKPISCNTCGGQGLVQQVRQSLLGQMMTTVECPECRGHGSVIAKPCERCQGNGVHAKPKRFTVGIPLGVSTGVTQRLSGMGPAGPRGGGHGDIHIRYQVAAHERFERVGDDLHEELWIPVTQAALGALLEYETIENAETLQIPAGTKTGEQFRFRGKGVPRLQRRGRGDLIVTVVVDTPTNLSKGDKALLLKLAEGRKEEVSSKGLRSSKRH